MDNAITMSLFIRWGAESPFSLMKPLRTCTDDLRNGCCARCYFNNTNTIHPVTFITVSSVCVIVGRKNHMTIYTSQAIAIYTIILA